MVKHIWRLALVIGIVSLFGMLVGTRNTGHTVRAQTGATPTPAIVPLVPLTIGSDFDPATQLQLEAIEQQVRNARELDAPETLERRLVSPDELKTLVLEDLLADYTAEDAREDALFYGAFGFMPEDTDLLTITQDLMAEQVAGFYDTERDTMFVLSADGSLDMLSSIIYAHEYTHALQDQNFDLDGLMTDELAETAPDQALAILALAEGDAQLITMFYAQEAIMANPAAALELLGQISTLSSPAFDAAPAILQAELLFAYEQGLVFVQTLYNPKRDWSLVDRVYQRPPLSTEQILHPALYLSYEEPQAVDLRPLDELLAQDPAAVPWVLVRDQTLGEFYLREHLRLYVGEAMADSAAAGWGGDHFLLYGQPSSPATILAWKLAWDTVQDATEFNDVYNSHLASWFQTNSVTARNNFNCWERPGRTACKGDDDGETLVVIAPTLDLAVQVIDAQLQ